SACVHRPREVDARTSTGLPSSDSSHFAQGNTYSWRPATDATSLPFERDTLGASPPSERCSATISNRTASSSSVTAYGLLVLLTLTPLRSVSSRVLSPAACAQLGSVLGIVR